MACSFVDRMRRILVRTPIEPELFTVNRRFVAISSVGRFKVLLKITVRRSQRNRAPYSISCTTPWNSSALTQWRETCFVVHLEANGQEGSGQAT